MSYLEGLSRAFFSNFSFIKSRAGIRDLAFIKVPTLLVYFTTSKVAALAT